MLITRRRLSARAASPSYLTNQGVVMDNERFTVGSESEVCTWTVQVSAATTCSHSLSGRSEPHAQVMDCVKKNNYLKPKTQLSTPPPPCDRHVTNPISSLAAIFWSERERALHITVGVLRKK